VRAIFRALLDEKLESYSETIQFIIRQSDQKTAEIQNLKRGLLVATAKLDELEAYSRHKNLIISRLSLTSAAEAVTTPTISSDVSSRDAEKAVATEKSVPDLCQQQMTVAITAADISVAQGLNKKPAINGPPAVMMRFTNRKANDLVYAARRRLKTCPEPSFNR
jgi:hypothetical protein